MRKRHLPYQLVAPAHPGSNALNQQGNALANTNTHGAQRVTATRAM
jgi:hypothetical protein